MPGSVSGYVVRAHSEDPIVDASITVVPITLARLPDIARIDDPEHPATVLIPDISPVTDDAGWFSFDGLPQGEFLFRALGPEGEVGEAKVYVYDDAVSEVTIEAA